MPLPSNNPHTLSNAATGKLGQRQSRASLTRLLFRQTMIAAAISTVMKKGQRATAVIAKPVLVRGRLQLFKTSMIFQAALALILGATGQGAIAIGSYSIDGRTDSNNWFIDNGTLIVDINDEGASEADANPSNDYRSILVWETDPGPIYFRSNRDGADYASQVMDPYANSPADQSSFSSSFYGPSIFNVVAWYNTKVPGPRPMHATIDPVWLDSYSWQSGYIHIEPQKTDKIYNYAFGYGYVPGIINIANTGCTALRDEKECVKGLDPNAGGSVTLKSVNSSVQGLINIVGSVGYKKSEAVPDAMSTSLPWRSAGAAISLTSTGGSGDNYFSGSTDESTPGGSGGSVALELTNYRINIGPKGSLKARNDAPFAALSAVSKGGNGLNKGTLLSSESTTISPSNFQRNGVGGTVDVKLTDVLIMGNTTHLSPYVIGAVAASVGGATQHFRPITTRDKKDTAISPGSGGYVYVELSSSTIRLPSNNSIGLIATSTGDEMLVNVEPLEVFMVSAAVNDVTVNISADSSILVGQQEGFNPADANAGDTNIAVLANASSNWGRELFTGADLQRFVSGRAGGVTVSNAGDVSAYGPNAVGVLAQSIGGKSISSPGITPVGDVNPSITVTKGSSLSNSDAGSVTYTSQSVNGTYGGSISAYGDGATGLLLQSIGGGGGAGGNATGLFVAVGGQGGNGGIGGTVTVTLQDQNVTTTGDYAKGVIGHSIGGGGGSGGHAKAFSLLPALPAIGIGGAGGDGGDGGIVTFAATNASVTTTGQHAMGLTFQSIGGGGGTGGGVQNYDATLGVTFQVAVGGSGGSGGSGGDLTVTIDENSSVLTSGLDSHGVLLHSVSGGGGAGGTAAGETFNIGNIPIPDFPKINVSVSVGGSAGNGDTGGDLDITNKGTITTKGAGSYGLVMQSIGGGGGHGADSTAGANSWGGAKPPMDLNTSVAVAGSAGSGADGGSVTLTNSGTISTQGHNAMGLLAQSIGGGGGVGGTGNAYETERWFGDSAAEKTETSSFSFAVGATVADGTSGGAGGDGGAITVTISPDKGTGFTTIGSGSSAVTLQSIGGSGGVGGDAGTQGINGQNVDVLVGGGGGSAGIGGEIYLQFAGNIQTGGVAQLLYTDSNNQQQASSPVTIGGSSHGILAQSIGGGGGSAGNAAPSTSLVPNLTKNIVTWKPTKKQLKIKKGIEYWAKRATDDGSMGASSSSSDDPDYTATVNVGGSGGSGAHGGEVKLEVVGQSDITIFGHHSYGILGQSIGGGGGIAAAASSKSLISGTVDVGKDDSASLTVSVGGSKSSAGDGGDVIIAVTNPLSNSYQALNNAAPGNYIRTGGYASHAIFGQSIGGGGGVGHEGSIIGFSKIQGKSTPKATLGNTNKGGVTAGDGGDVYVGTKDTPITGWMYTAGDASTLLFAQSVGGGGGTISFGCTTNSRNGNNIVRPSPCFTDATPTSTWDGNPTTAQTQAFTNPAQVFDLAANGAGGDGGDVEVYLGDSHVVTDGDRSIGIVAQSIGGGGGYISADAQNVGSITQSSPSSSVLSWAGDVSVELVGGNGRNAYLATYGDGAWGILAQSIAGGGGLLGDTALNINGVPVTPTTNNAASSLSGFVSVDIYANSIVKTEGKNSHGVVMQSWSGGGGIFAGSGQNPNASLVMGEKTGGTAARGGYDEDWEKGYNVGLVVHSGSTIEVNGEQSIAVLAQSNVLPIFVNVVGTVQGGQTVASSTSADGTNGLPGTGVMLSGGGQFVSNRIDVQKDGKLTTYKDSLIGYAIRTNYGTTNVTNAGTIIGSVDLGSTPGTFTNESGGVLNKGKIYKVGNNSLHNYGTINIGDEDSVSTTNLEGRIVQYEGGRTLVTFDVLGEQTNDRLIVDGTAVLGGSFETRAKSLLPGSYEFLTATDLTVTAEAADRLLYAWDATVSDTSVTVTPTRAYRPEGLRLSTTSRNLVPYLERAWDNADAHHAALFGYKHELEGIEDYNSLLEGLSGQALNAQPLQMRMMALTSLGDGMSCPVVTPVGLSLGQDNCVWARITGDVSDLTGDGSNLGYRASGGGLRVGVQHKVDSDWTVGASLGYGLNDLTATNFSSNGEFFDASISATRRLGQLSLGGSLAFAQGWFDNSRQVKATAAGIAPGFNRQFNSDSRQSVYAAKLRAAYTFEQEESHYIRPYVDLDLIYSESPGFNESGTGELALRKGSTSQFNVGISPMVEFGSDFLTEDKTRVKVFVSAGATFLPNNKQTTATSFVGASAANGTFDVVTNGPDVLGRLNLGVEVFQSSGFQVRAQYGLQAGQNYLSQSLSANLVYRF